MPKSTASSRQQFWLDHRQQAQTEQAFAVSPFSGARLIMRCNSCACRESTSSGVLPPFNNSSNISDLSAMSLLLAAFAASSKPEKANHYIKPSPVVPISV